MAIVQKIEERLRGISREVEEFHPLLAEFFSKNTHIARYEYTHGQTEMGADFILVRNHEILNRQEYIGVVAKVGKIHQDLAEVNRQIEECLTIPRHLEGGKKEVYLSEVWVIATDTITNGAQRKIHAAHKGSKIHFLTGPELATHLAKWVPHYWSNVPIETSSYLSAVKNEAREKDARLDILQVDGEPLYMPQDVVRVEIDPYRRGKAAPRGKAKKVSVVEELQSNPVLFIEADMGGGKSKLIRHHLQDLGDETNFPDRPWLPVSCSYKSLLDSYEGSVTRLFNAVVPKAVKEQLPDDARIIFFIDALDEKEQDQVALIESLHEIVSEIGSDKRYRAVLTSRHVGNLEFDKRFAHSLARYEIRRLSIGQIAAYLEEVCRRLNLTNRVVDDLRKSPLFARLPQTPLAAVLLAQLLRENPQDLPSTLPELYSKYLELALGRWDIGKGLQTQQQYETVEAVLMGLARYMLENELESISTAEFRDRIRSYLEERNLRVTVEDVLKKAVGRSEVLVRSRQGDRVWFKHRSFAEYLEAKRRVRAGTLTPSLQAFELYWGNVFYFGCGELRDCPELITGLADLAPIDEQHRWLKAMNMANYVMAAYATPYPAIQDAVHKSVREAASLLCDIASGVLVSPFSDLTRMDLVCLVQLVVRDHYGFQFLGSALEFSALRLLDEPHDDTTPYALFLLAVAYGDAGRDNAFDFLLEEYQHQLPIDLSLAVFHESQRGGGGKLLKRFNQRLKRRVRGNDQLNHDIDLLYDRPIVKQIAAASAEGQERGRS